MAFQISSFKSLGACVLALSVVAGFAPVAVQAATISEGSATARLGRNLFIDNASPGGGDAQATQPEAVLSRNDFGQLNVGPGGSRIEITGVAWACPNNHDNNDASSIQVRVVYLGADGQGGGGDDVVIGSASGDFRYTGAGEYVFVFDEPFSAVVDGRGTFFRLDVRPSNAAGTGSIRLKTDGNLPKVSVAGTSTAVAE